MKQNNTNCVSVCRVFRIETAPEHFETIRMKEFMFKDQNAHECRRYCLLYDGKGYISHEHSVHKSRFFDEVVKAHSGRALFNAYCHEKIQAVYTDFRTSYEKKYQLLKEFYVIYNVHCGEHNLARIFDKKQRKNSLEDAVHDMIVYSM